MPGLEGEPWLSERVLLPIASPQLPERLPSACKWGERRQAPWMLPPGTGPELGQEKPVTHYRISPGAAPAPYTPARKGAPRRQGTHLRALTLWEPKLGWHLPGQPRGQGQECGGKQRSGRADGSLMVGGHGLISTATHPKRPPIPTLSRGQAWTSCKVLLVVESCPQATEAEPRTKVTSEAD